MNYKLFLLVILSIVIFSYSTNVFAESEEIHKNTISNVFAKEDYMTLDKQNYLDGDIVIMSGLIEELKEGHSLIEITVHPSGEVSSMHYGKQTNGFFGSGSRIIESSWDDGIYKIIVSGAGKEFAEIFGVNYVLTEDDLKQHEQEKIVGKQIQKFVESFVSVREDTKDYVQGGLVKIFGFVHLNEHDQTSLDEQVTLKFFRENSKIAIHEVKVSLDKYNEFSYSLDTSDEIKWEYTSQTNKPPFGTPTGFYYVTAEFADLTADDDFLLKATDEKVIDLSSMLEQTTLPYPTENIDTGNVTQTNDDSNHHESYLEWIEDSYSPSGTSVVFKITDHDKNIDPNKVDHLIARVYSNSVSGVHLLSASETSTNTGVFEGILHYTHNKDKSSSNNVFVADGQIITVIYERDTLLFRPYIPIDDKSDMVETSIIQNTSELPPHKQVKHGILSSEIKCKSEYELIFKHNNSPACVKPLSVNKLLERGYTLAIK